MGRIEDALRRSREAGTDSPAAVDDIGTLAREPFPTEGGAAAAVPQPPVVPAASTAAGSDAQAHLNEHLHQTLTGKVVTEKDIVPASREQYRRLGATLLHGQEESGIKVIMVTSAAVGEGKTLTASNLALTLSESYKRKVLLVDADLRRPSVNRIFGTEGKAGLSEALIARNDTRLPWVKVSPYLTILPAGQPSQDPMAGLSSQRMRRIIAEARDLFDWVIVDTPPVGLLSDANLVGALADGIVLVVRAGVTHYDLVQRAANAVGRDRVLGVVLNSVEAERSPAYYSYRHYYGPSRTTS
jgi:capsular exopolysaccharide synthesis family protein